MTTTKTPPAGWMPAAVAREHYTAGPWAWRAEDDLHNVGHYLVSDREHPDSVMVDGEWWLYLGGPLPTEPAPAPTVEAHGWAVTNADGVVCITNDALMRDMVARNRVTKGDTIRIVPFIVAVPLPDTEPVRGRVGGES